MRFIVFSLAVLSALFVGRSALEMYVWTPARGPQMVFFSLTHTWPAWAVMLFFFSWLAYFALMFALVLVIAAAGLEKVLGLPTLPGAPEGLSKSRRPMTIGVALTSTLHALAWPRGTRSFRIVIAASVLLLLHLLAMSTYDHWSNLFNGAGS